MDKRYLEAVTAREFFEEVSQCYIRIRNFKRKLQGLEEERYFTETVANINASPEDQERYSSITKKQQKLVRMFQEELDYWESIRLATEKALAKIPVEEAEVLSMKYLEGMSYKETMFALKMSRGTYNRRLKNGLASFEIPCIEDTRTYIYEEDGDLV